MYTNYGAMGYELSVREITRAISDLYPPEMSASISHFYIMALCDGIITSEEFDHAKDYYGRLWNYTGD